jgi:hypothetical protein
LPPTLQPAWPPIQRRPDPCLAANSRSDALTVLAIRHRRPPAQPVDHRPPPQHLDLHLLAAPHLASCRGTQTSTSACQVTCSRRPDRARPARGRKFDEHGTEGRYAVEKPLAQGGMGAVLLIKDGDFQRPAAMKVMLSRFAKSPEALERFLAEAQVTAQLEHPNIVPLHDMGIMDDGTVYFTMKFIQGESLGSVVKSLRSDDAALREARPSGMTNASPDLPGS